MTSRYDLMYSDAGSGAKMNGAFYRPLASADYFILGDYAQSDHEAPTSPSLTITVIQDDPRDPALMAPTSYIQVWDDDNSGAKMDGSIWVPEPPTGYVALGAVAQTGYGMPDIPRLRCVRADLVKPAAIGAVIWNDKGSGATKHIATYQIVGLTTFYAQGNYDPPAGPAWTLGSLG
jgi:hypothetical protein